MGVCGGRASCKQKKFILPRDLQQKSLVVHPIETELLYMIFNDLASRNVDNYVNKTAFTDFFTMIGLWSQLVFDYFNKETNNMVNFEQFLIGVEYFVKCNEEQKVEHLFKLYDLNKEGTITKEEFLQMIQNYPREDLIQLLDDQTFLQEQHILDYHKRKQRINKKTKPLKSDEQDFKESLQFLEQRRRSISKHSQSKHDSQSSENMVPLKEESVNMMFPNDSMIGTTGVPMGQFGQNLVFNVNGKQIELKRVNINYLVQKYVNMIYKGKDHDEQEISIEEFKQFVHKHPKIFHGIYKAFNYDIWGIDDETSVPRLSIVPKDLEGTVYKVSRKNPKIAKERYFKLIKHFCLSFKSQTSALPSRIICLDGLIIQEISDQQQQKYGFEISHKDKLYPSREYQCSTFEDFKKWTTNLQIFQKASVNDYYSILQKIGEGKFSIVYLCQCKKSKENLAIKIIDKFKLSKMEKFMLAHEVDIMKLLNHSCIIKFHEIIETKTQLHIITELVKDGDLFDYIVKNELLCEQEASLIMSQLLDTIHYIHTVGIVHRDLKPENIMIVYDATKKIVKQVKLIDFGFANYLTNLQNRDEAICGTTNYLAPESLESKRITFKVDNFSLGVILYFLLSGYLPFDSEFPEDVIRNIMDCTYDMDDDFWKQISTDAKDLISKLLQKEPNDRISTADALRHPWITNRNNLSTTKASRQKKVVLF